MTMAHRGKEDYYFEVHSLIRRAAKHIRVTQKVILKHKPDTKETAQHTSSDHRGQPRLPTDQEETLERSGTC